MPPGPKRRTALVQVLLTPDERKAFDRLAKERNTTLTELIVTSVLGEAARPSLGARIAELERRVDNLELVTYVPDHEPRTRKARKHGE